MAASGVHQYANKTCGNEIGYFRGDTWLAKSAGRSLLCSLCMRSVSGTNAARRVAAMLERRQPDIAPDVGDLHVSKSISAICAFMPEVVESTHEVTFEKHCVWVF